MCQSSSRLLSETKDSEDLYPIRPADIKLWDDGSIGIGAHFGGSIRVGVLSPQKMRRVAGALVRYFQSRGYWCAFALEDLVEFYRSRDLVEHLSMPLYGLSGKYVIFEDGRYHATDDFVQVCTKGGDEEAFRKQVDGVAQRILDRVSL